MNTDKPKENSKTLPQRSQRNTKENQNQSYRKGHSRHLKIGGYHGILGKITRRGLFYHPWSDDLPGLRHYQITMRTSLLTLRRRCWYFFCTPDEFTNGRSKRDSLCACISRRKIVGIGVEGDVGTYFHVFSLHVNTNLCKIYSLYIARKETGPLNFQGTNPAGADSRSAI